MIAIDTNVLVRYITNDDAEQAKIAITLLEQYKGQENVIFINDIVICELAWVLDRGYKYNKTDIIKTLKLLLTSTEFAFKHHDILILAVLEYESSKADIADILIGLLNHNYGCSTTYSFDKAAASTLHIHELK